MRVLIVGLATFDQMAGGSARYLSGLADGLERLGHEVEVRTAAQHVATKGYSETGFAGQAKRAIRRFLVHMPRTFAAVRSTRPDVVNSHFALDGLPAVLGALVWRRPVVVTLHGPWALEAVATGRRGGWPMSTRARKSLERWVYRRAAYCITLSHAFAALLVDEYGVRPDRVRVIPGGLDTGRFADLPTRSECRRRLGVEERFTIVAVRRLVPRMGLDLAIDALSQISTETDAQLLIAGIGPERGRLEQHARARGVENRVKFLGRIGDTDLPLLYAAADMCVVPSRQLEGFGYAALESLAAGTPVIAAGTGGLVELVGGLEARWVTGADGAAIAETVRRYRADAGSYPDRAACQAYAREMDWTKIAPRVVDVFASATRSRGQAK